MKINLRTKTATLDSPTAVKKFYEDEYAMLSFVESVPCIKVRLSGVPHSSDHFQFVYGKLIDYIQTEIIHYCRLHMLTDNSKAGLVLDEDVLFYKEKVIPEMEKAGIRYHAVVLPESTFLRMVINDISLSTKKIKVEY